MNHLSEIPKLTDEEFSKLLSDYRKTGDVSIRNRIVLAFGYIAQVSAMQLRGVASTSTQIEDMVNQGMITLMDCIEKFDDQKGMKFESYAYMRVRGGIIDMIRRQDWIPRRVRVYSKKINETYNRLHNELRR